MVSFVPIILEELHSQSRRPLAPFLLHLRTIQTCISQMPSLLLDNNITFIDVLGRTRSIPYIYYRSWDVCPLELIANFPFVTSVADITEISPQRLRENT